MSVCSSGVQRRKKLENKQKFVFDEKDVVAPPPRAAVRSSVQVKPYFFFMLFAFIPISISAPKDRLARAREGKDGRPPRFDPVLDEVAAKLEKEVSKCSALCCEILLTNLSSVSCLSKQVARIKLGEKSATEIGECLKAKTAHQGGKAGKAPVNFGLKPSYAVDYRKVRISQCSLLYMLFL